MLTVTEKALEHIQSRGQAIFLEMPIIIQGDITFCESPAVRWGLPKNPQYYQQLVIDGIEVYIPHDLPKIPLRITVSRFLWIKWLAVEGWALA